MQPDGANQLEEMADSIPPRMMAKEALNSSSKLTAHSFLRSTNSRIENSIWCHKSEAAAFEPVHRQPAPAAPSLNLGVINCLDGQSSCPSHPPTPGRLSSWAPGDLHTTGSVSGCLWNEMEHTDAGSKQGPSRVPAVWNVPLSQERWEGNESQPDRDFVIQYLRSLLECS